MWYVYVLQSVNTGELYTGYTEDLKQRFKQHSNGSVTSTKSIRPLRIVYYEAFLSREDAAKEERFLKTGYGREVLRVKARLSLQS